MMWIALRYEYMRHVYLVYIGVYNISMEYR